GRAEAGGRPVHVYTYDPDADRFSLASSEPIPVRAIGLVEEEDRDLIVAMNPASWFTISPSGQVDMSGGSDLMDAAALAPVGDCQLGQLRRDVLAVSTSGQVAVYSASGERIQDWAGGGPTMVDELLAAGCVRGVDATYPAAVFSIVDGERPILAIDAPRTQPAVVNSAIDRGFAFTPVLESGEGPFLLANRLETDGNSIARYTVVPVDGAPTFLDESGEDEIAGLSAASAGGDFDGDGRLDVASITAFALGDGRLELRFFMALGIVVEEERLFGLDDESVPGAGPSPLLLTADFDRDGIDDLLVVTLAGFSLFELEPE
ncbi:MAG TPA: VCBS repeat-containing protein, partial [Kofleriaceae bacterium]|nr:VCBS repeat-containing protein [Kofleriaceae bacterium]